jgi:cell wall-associated NlpC family hydrolase
MKRFWFVLAVVASVAFGGSGVAQSAVTGSDAAGDYAKAQVGKPVVWGATGPNAFDAPGLVWRAYKEAGVAFPRSVRSQFSVTEAIDYDDLEKGDLIFYYNKSHVAIYFGDGNMVEASGDFVWYLPVRAGGEARTYPG